MDHCVVYLEPMDFSTVLREIFEFVELRKALQTKSEYGNYGSSKLGCRKIRWQNHIVPNFPILLETYFNGWNMSISTLLEGIGEEANYDKVIARYKSEKLVMALTARMHEIERRQQQPYQY